MSGLAKIALAVVPIAVNFIPGIGPLAAIGISLAAGVASSQLNKVKKTKATSSAPAGISVQTTLQGGTNSRTIMLGLYASAGSEACPPMSHGKDGQTPNAYFTKVFALGDVPIDGISRIIINGEYVPIGETAEEYGLPLGDKYAGYAWLKFYDGRQTVADPMLVAKYSGYVRPWNNDRIGTGCPYAILTLKFNADLFKSSVPDVKFELRGMRAYDVRKDSAAGGSGSHRWGQPDTYEFTTNNIVLTYNLLRGVTLADGSVYGGRCEAADLPLANWVAGMNVCDEDVETADGVEPRYRCGFEFQIASDEPAGVIEELLKGCSASIVETGGVYRVRVGPPTMPVMFLTDKDFYVSSDSDYDPFPGIASSSNTVHASYPNPAESWQAHDAPPVTDAAYVAQDAGQEITADLSLPAVPYPLQVQRLMLGWLKDDRRWRQHSSSVGPYAFVLEPLDTIAWTSAYNGYVAKWFEIGTAVENLMTLEKRLSIREVDPSDYDWSPDFELPDPVSPGVWNLPPVQAVPGWAVEAVAIKDNTGALRRPAIRASWAPAGAEDAKLLKIQVRLATTGVAVSEKTVTNVTDGEVIISEGILPATAYQLRGQYIVDRPTEWSTWLSVTTGNYLLDDRDVAGYTQLQTDTANALDYAASALADAADAIDQANQAIADVSGLADDVTAQGGYINDLTTQLGTQGGQIVTLQSTVSNHTGSLATLTTRVSAVYASNVNLLKNGGFTDGFKYWTSNKTVTVASDFWGPVAYVFGAVGDVSYVSSPVLVAEIQTYTAALDITFIDDAGYCLINIVWYDISNIYLGESVGTYRNAPFDFDATGQGRIANTCHGQPPAGAVHGVFHCRFFGLSGSYQGGAGYIGIRQAKLELGSIATPFSDQNSVYSVTADVKTVTQAVATLDTQVASLTVTVSTQGAAISTNATALSNAISDIASNTSSLTTANANIYNQSLAITSLQGNQASIQTELIALQGSPNLLKNGGFTRDLDYWGGDLIGWSVGNSGLWGYYAIAYGKSGTNVITTEIVEGIQAGAPYTFTGDPLCIADSGSVYFDIIFLDASNNTLLDSGQITRPASFDFSQDLSGRKASATTVIAPAGAAKAFGRFVWSGLTATNGGGPSVIGCRLVKLERGSYVTPYSDQGAVGDGMARIKSEEIARATADGVIASNLATVSTTVGNHTASIASQQLSINGLFARASVTLDINGYMTGWETNNNGSYGDFTIRADKFSIVSPGGGARTEYSAGNWRVYDSAGTLRVRLGVW